MKRLALILFPALLFAQVETPPRMPPHVVRATGEGTVTAKPDQARISVGVMTEASTAEDAVSQNATKSSALLAALKSAIGSGGELKTTGYSVNPQYRYDQGRAPVITGYAANQTVEATLTDITLVGKVIDASSKAGANHVNSIEFTLKNDQAVREQAIAKATASARANAESIAKALGVSVTGVAWAETTEATAVRPIMAPMMMKGQAMMQQPATQIESGNLDIHASVTVALEIH
jgi:hypothetical protein